ncbi:MAG: NERD domain-containing protein [Gammaproteobacteria bacterium]|nr:NERD domain-containing protein [Gammaproteobacteria bacterium]
MGPMGSTLHQPWVPWVLLGIAVALIIAAVWLVRWYRRRRARRALQSAVAAAGMEHLIDMAVPDGMGGSYHVDFLLLSVHGILIVDVRQVQGNIFGGDQMAEWTVMDGPHRFTFVNPQSGLYDRIAAVKAIVGEVPIEGRVVFTREGRFPKGLPKWTVMIDELAAEFPSFEADVAEAMLTHYREAWERLRASVRPSTTPHMR